jgi:hypothetical protein
MNRNFCRCVSAGLGCLCLVEASTIGGQKTPSAGVLSVITTGTMTSSTTSNGIEYPAVNMINGRIYDTLAGRSAKEVIFWKSS